MSNNERNLKTAIIITVLNAFSTFIDINNFSTIATDANSLIRNLLIPLFSVTVIIIYSINNLHYFKNVIVNNAKISKSMSILALILACPLLLIISLILLMQLEVISTPSNTFFDIYIQFKTGSLFGMLNTYIPSPLKYRYIYLVVFKGLALILQSIATILKEKYNVNKENEGNNEP